MKNIQEILQSISNDILTEEVKGSIVTVFNEAVNVKIKEAVSLEVQNELEKMDKDHSNKLEKLVEAIDEDHTKKFKLVIEKLDRDHTAKLKKIIEKYNVEIDVKANELRNELTDKISNYLDLYLEKAIPTEQLKEAVDNIHARKLINEIKRVVVVDEEFVTDTFKQTLKEGHDAIEGLRKQLDEKTKENININQKLIGTQSRLLLEKKTLNLPENKRKYVYKLLEGKQPKEIEANFDYVIEMFEKDEAEKSEMLVESAKERSSTLSKKIDAPKSTINEEVQPKSDFEVEQSNVGSFLDELKKLDGNR